MQISIVALSRRDSCDQSIQLACGLFVELNPKPWGDDGISRSIGDPGCSFGYAPHDPERVMVHNGLWSPLLSGSAGTGMAWDWNWLDDDHFYRYIQAVAQAVKDIPFSRRTWRDVQVQAFEFADASRGPYYADTLIDGFPGNYMLLWLKHPEFN